VFTAVAGRVATARQAAADEAQAVERERERTRREHVILVGYGTVGQLLAKGAKEEDGRALVVIEEQADLARAAAQEGLSVVNGNAASPQVLREAGIEAASKLVIAIPEGFEAGAIAERAREMNTEMMIFARAHSDEEVNHLARLGADHVVMGEREIARRLLRLMASARTES